MKQAIPFILFLLATFSAKANSVDTVKVNTVDKTIQIGKILIAKDSSIAALLTLLGKPDVSDAIGGVENRRLIYNNLGIAIETSEDGKKLKGVSFTFNPDGDKKTASGQFKGVLIVDGYQITETCTGDNLKENTQLKNLKCIPNLMCMTDLKTSDFVVLVGYQTEKITQMGFGFK
jgi:hypothetical protein